MLDLLAGVATDPESTVASNKASANVNQSPWLSCPEVGGSFFPNRCDKLRPLSCTTFRNVLHSERSTLEPKAATNLEKKSGELVSRTLSCAKKALNIRVHGVGVCIPASAIDFSKAAFDNEMPRECGMGSEAAVVNIPSMAA